MHAQEDVSPEASLDQQGHLEVWRSEKLIESPRSGNRFKRSVCHLFSFMTLPLPVNKCQISDLVHNISRKTLLCYMVWGNITS